MTRTAQNVQCLSNTFDDITGDWLHLQEKAENSTIFSTFAFSHLWWRHFGKGSILCLKSVHESGQVIGIAPLRVKDGIVQFIGSSNICDYLDFVVLPDRRPHFFDALFRQLRNEGLTRLELAPVRPDSAIMLYLNSKAGLDDITVTIEREDVTFELHLPDSWENYFPLLSSKQRHELRRKIRRVAELGEYRYTKQQSAGERDIEEFFRLFRTSRSDKQAFLTPEIERYFRDLIDLATKENSLELNFMSINNVNIAATLCFNYKKTTYLYNSGYAPEYRDFSVGLVSKALGIKTSIEQKKEVFDFLKGSEIYKQHLGGKEIPLYHLSINLMP